MSFEVVLVGGAGACWCVLGGRVMVVLVGDFGGGGCGDGGAGGGWWNGLGYSYWFWWEGEGGMGGMVGALAGWLNGWDGGRAVGGLVLMALVGWVDCYDLVEGWEG